MDVADLIAEAKSVQARLVAALQSEYFCEDIKPPPEAFGWPEDRLKAFFESGGEDLTDPTTIHTTPPNLPLPPLPPQPSPAVEEAPPGRPIILCLGDSTTEFGLHIINQPTADVGSSKHKASLSVVVEPVASEFLRETNTDNPRVEHGPGWIALLARDYAWRTTADVVNRGYSGYTSTMLLADLPELLSTIRVRDVVGVTLCIGSNDAVAEDQLHHVPLATYKTNMASLLTELKARLPNAKPPIVLGPPPVEEAQWQETVKRVTAGRKDGKERSAVRVAEYSAVAKTAASAAGCKYIDMIYKLK